MWSKSHGRQTATIRNAEVEPLRLGVPGINFYMADFLSPLVTSVAAVFVAAFATLLQGLLFRGRAKTAAQTTLEDRIAQLGTTMSAAAAAMAAIQAELEAQEATAKQVAEDVEQGRRLAELNAEAKEAVAVALRAELAQQSKRALWQGIGINALFLIAGGAITLAVTLWVHPLL